MKKTLLLTLLAAIFGSCSNKQVTLPKYTEIEHKIYSIPAKRQISVRVYLNEPGYTNEQLNELTDSLYLAAKYERTQYGDPTHVFIYVYAKQGDYESESGSWIASRQKIQNDEQQTTIKAAQ
jgi:gamma-glutamylcyclotransferase (GGCT)/AIG2-like uncharacterized protein YtfP